MTIIIFIFKKAFIFNIKTFLELCYDQPDSYQQSELMFDQSTVDQITIFLDINRIRHKMVKNAIKVGNIRRKTSLGQNFFA